MDFKQKYFKYKNKYLKLRNQETNSNLEGGSDPANFAAGGGDPANFAAGGGSAVTAADGDSSSYSHNTQGTPRWEYLEATNFCSKKENDEKILEIIEMEDDNYNNNGIFKYNNNNFIGHIVFLHMSQTDKEGNIVKNLKLFTQIIYMLETPLYNITLENKYFGLEIAIRKSKCKHNPKYDIYSDLVILLKDHIDKITTK